MIKFFTNNIPDFHFPNEISGAIQTLIDNTMSANNLTTEHELTLLKNPYRIHHELLLGRQNQTENTGRPFAYEGNDFIFKPKTSSLYYRADIPNHLIQWVKNFVPNLKNRFLQIGQKAT